LLLMRALARRGHRQRLLARAGAPLLEQALREGLAAEALTRGLRLPAADVVHAHDARAHTSAALRSRATPLVVSRRVAFSVGRRWWSRTKYARAALYIAVSRYVARELEFAGVPGDRIAVIFDGVSLPDLATAAERRAEFRRRLGLPHAAFVAGTLTTLREKPVGPLLEAAATRPLLHVLVMASDAASHEAHEAPKGSGPGSGHVRLLAPEADISAFLFSLDALVHLSESEGLGSAALLAMAHGLPVIASDSGGLPEIVRDGETGLLVRNNALEVGAALEKLNANREEARAWGARGRRFIETTATDDIMAERSEQVYLRAIADKVARNSRGKESRPPGTACSH